MSEKPFSEDSLDSEKQKTAQRINELQPTGDLLHDIDALAKIVGASIDRYFTDPITGKQETDPTNPEAVYQHYMSPESQNKLSQTYDDPVHAAHVEAIKRILKACKEKSSS